MLSVISRGDACVSVCVSGIHLSDDRDILWTVGNWGGSGRGSEKQIACKYRYFCSFGQNLWCRNTVSDCFVCGGYIKNKTAQHSRTFVWCGELNQSAITNADIFCWWAGTRNWATGNIGQRTTGAKSPGSIGNQRRHFIHHISTICQLRLVLGSAKPRVVNVDGTVGI